MRKLFSEQWRDNRRALRAELEPVSSFPHDVTVWLDPFATALTYLVLMWELLFVFALAYGPARRTVLVLGVLLHLGMLATIEIGPFGLVMLAGYAAFLEPSKVPTMMRRICRRLP